MPEPGYVGFDVDYLLGPDYYCNGEFFPSCPVSVQPAPGLLILATHGGTHIPQRSYRAPDKPASYDQLVFSLTVRAVDNDAWMALKRAKAVGAPFYFATGMRRHDYFVTSAGGTYDLSRRLATGVVPGISEGTHPTVITGGTGSVAGRTLTATSSGPCWVEYTPVHLVYFSNGFPESIIQQNQMDAQAELTEVLE